MPGQGARKYSIYNRVPSKENGQLMFKRLRLLDGVWERTLKDSVRVRPAECMISLGTILCWLGGEVTEGRFGLAQLSTFWFQLI